MKKFGASLILEISAIFRHCKKTKTNGLHCDFRVKQFAHKKRSVRNAESVKTQIVACVFSLIVRPKITFQNSNFSIPDFLPFDKICDFQMHAFTTVRQSCKLAVQIYHSQGKGLLWIFRNTAHRFFGFRPRYNFLS